MKKILCSILILALTVNVALAQSPVRLMDAAGKFTGVRTTYRASGQLVAPAGAFPFLVLSSKVGVVVRVTKIRITNATLTAAQILRIQIAKVSTLPTGGTPTTPAKVPLDSNSGAAGATFQAYTAAPTAGTVVGQIAEFNVNGLVTAATANTDDKLIDFGQDMRAELVLIRGAAEGVTVAFAAAASAVTLSYDIEWNEDGN